MDKRKNISNKPGVYIFKNGDQKTLYVGKAGNLKKRLAFYFSKTEKTPKLSKLMTEAKNLQIIETGSEIEALIKEAELIKKHLPKYNVLMRDDKNYFYVSITSDKFPKIFITHQPNTYLKFQNPKSKLQIKSPPSLKLRRTSKIQNPKSETNFIGPFTDGGALKTTLRLLRRIFPYCTCKEFHKRPCLNSEIGRCPGYCCLKPKTNDQRPTTNNLRNYKNNIEKNVAVLKGKKQQLLAELKRKMKVASKKQEFEKAAVLRDQIWGLENIFEHRQLLEVGFPKRGPTSQNLESALQALLQTNKAILRIEGYDISNISGKEATGSMVVFTKNPNGYFPDKSQYRKFKIKTVKGISDVDMMAEVIKRRFNHPEWPYPDLTVVDGGKQQLHAAAAVLKSQITKTKLQTNSKFKIPIITALAKREEELYIENKRLPIKLKKQPEEILHLFQRIRDESHRFAKKYHHERRKLLFRKK